MTIENGDSLPIPNIDHHSEAHREIDAFNKAELEHILAASEANKRLGKGKGAIERKYWETGRSFPEVNGADRESFIEGLRAPLQAAKVALEGYNINSSRKRTDSETQHLVDYYTIRSLRQRFHTLQEPGDEF